MADELVSRDAARADLARLLAACYYEPDATLAEEKVFDSLHTAAAAIDAALGDHAARLRDAYAADDPQTLLVDYTRLFLGPVQALARPYGSVWLERPTEVMQDSTAAVTALYAEGGFEIDEGFRELPDHVAAELEFLYLLTFRALQARASEDDAARAAANALRTTLLAEHIGRWCTPFTAALRDGAQTSFYRELAELTEAFIRRERHAHAL
jgi:TorA maturation chaperone TorD